MSCRRIYRAFVGCLSLAVASAAVIGCAPKPSGSTSTTAGNGGAAATVDTQSQYRRELLQSALSLLNSTEQYDDEVQLSQLIVERLNQWRRATQPSSEENTGPSEQTSESDEKELLLDTLNKDLLDSRWVRRLNSDAFDPSYDGSFLREAVLLHDVATHVDTDKLDDLSLAEALFDWTVRNIQLEPQPGSEAKPAEQWMALHLPLDTLYLGRGTPLQRAWVFMLLARQAGLDIVLLATPESRNPGALRPWVTALVSGDRLYLFDFTYGLPILGPNGKGVATLSQAAADDAILRQMDIPGDRPYPKKASDLENVTALIEASPGYLARRMKLLEKQLTGSNRATLSVSPSAIAAKVKDMKGVGDVKLWALPYEILKARADASPELQRAAQVERLPFSIAANPEQSSKKQDDSRKSNQRVYALRLGRLLHLSGNYGASANDLRSDQSSTGLSEIAERGAKYYYLRALPQQEQLEEVARTQREGREIAPGRHLIPEFVDAYQQLRDDAAYWLGLVWQEQKDYARAIQYFDKMMLQANPDGPWANGARYNLARCYEALGRLPEAIKLYQADKSPQRYGNRLRAERLRQQPADQSSDSKSQQ